ncbi:hypothetical protein F2P81_021470 [Scophthalmus maximus]|uniref:Uncharacterized protein n=1 Tax=Scophthalmus maximus TaxID=52904 RepID=A0A6A4RXA0_SCOMX|nr:hypothetical protein F2P81_021470 [Scophthalmus maximus]
MPKYSRSVQDQVPVPPNRRHKVTIASSSTGHNCAPCSTERIEGPEAASADGQQMPHPVRIGRVIRSPRYRLLVLIINLTIIDCALLGE